LKDCYLNYLLSIKNKNKKTYVVESPHLHIIEKIASSLVHFLKYSNKNKKGQNKKTTILLSYSVFLPERFFLRKSGDISFQ